MHPADIQAALKKKGFTQKAFAKKIGVAEMTVSRVIRRKELISDRVMKAISEEIGVSPYEVFPEYYFAKPQRSSSKAANF